MGSKVVNQRRGERNEGKTIKGKGPILRRNSLRRSLGNLNRE
jgi:hypothetical protein